jgi:hypothetical protein
MKSWETVFEELYAESKERNKDIVVGDFVITTMTGDNVHTVLEIDENRNYFVLSGLGHVASYRVYLVPKRLVVKTIKRTANAVAVMRWYQTPEDVNNECHKL